MAAVVLATVIAGVAAAQQSWTDDPVVAGETTIKAVHVEEIIQRIGALRQERGLSPATYTDRPRQGGTIRVSHVAEAISALAAVYREDGVAPPSYGEIAAGTPIRAATINALRMAISDRESGQTVYWRGIEVAPEDRCAPYDSDDYPYPQSVEDQIIAQLGGTIYSPYTCELFDSKRETDIEHIIARSEAHDSGLCDADAATRRRFAQDLLNLTLASPELNRQEKSGKDAAEWQPGQNTCWFAQTVVDVRLAYGLTVDPQERDALERMLAGCTSTAIACDLQPTNRAPEAVGAIPAQTLMAGGSASRVDVASYFRDPDNDPLTYAAASSSTGTVTTRVSGSTVTLTPAAAGTATVTVTADDGSLNAAQTIAVTVRSSVPSHPPVQTFRNCTLMKQAGWNRGVNRNGGTYQPEWDSAEIQTYNLNTARDRDRDGHACE